jgi:hypothetical protein
MSSGEGGKPPSYNDITANDRNGIRAKRPAFEPPAHLRDQLFTQEQGLRKEMELEPNTSHPQASKGWEPGKCIPQMDKPPHYHIKSTRVGEHTQFMMDHALIDKFLGLWPTERDLTRWIKDWWNPKGDYEVQLSSKGFFTIILYNLEDKDKIFDNGPYFYNSAGLFLRFWTDRFSPEKEDFTRAPVWIRLYSLPQEFWLEEILMGIGNTVGRYVKASEATKMRKYTSYARICIYMDISKALPGSIMLEYQDDDWNQTIDYEHIPFHCRKCHEHDHLFRDCPLNATATKINESKQKDGFANVTGRRKNPSRKQNQSTIPKIPTKNSYDVLNQLPEEEEIQNPHQATMQAKGKSTEVPNTTQSKETTHATQTGTDGDTTMLMDETDLADIDLEKLEEALNQKDLQHIPVDQLRKVHKVFTNSTAGSTARLGITVDPGSEPKRITKENKRRGCKTTHQLIKEAGHLMINSGQIQRLSEGYLHPPPPSS